MELPVLKTIRNTPEYPRIPQNTHPEGLRIPLNTPPPTPTKTLPEGVTSNREEPIPATSTNFVVRCEAVIELAERLVNQLNTSSSPYLASTRRESDPLPHSRRSTSVHES